MLVLNLAGASLADTRKTKPKNQTARLAALLPASDAIGVIDAKRFLNDAMPQILAANQPILAEITGKINEAKSTLGIDVRMFEEIAFGASAISYAGGKFDFDPVVLARGAQLKSDALIAVAKVASKGKYREEKIGAKTVYIFAARDIAKQNKPGDLTPEKSAQADKAINRIMSEIAVTSLDGNTLAIGSMARVRQTLEKKPATANAELTNLLYKKPSAVVNFAAKTPAGMGAFLPLDNDELGKTLDSIRFLSGSMDVSGAGANVNMTAKTTQAAQAEELLTTLQGLQMIGKAFLGGAKGADKEIYARLIDGASFSRTQTEVTLDLNVLQSDIDALIAKIKIS